MKKMEKHLRWIVALLAVGTLGLMISLGNIVQPAIHVAFAVLVLAIELVFVTEFVALSLLKSEGVDLEKSEFGIPIGRSFTMPASVALHVYKWLSIITFILAMDHFKKHWPKIVIEMNSDYWIPMNALNAFYSLLLVSICCVMLRLTFGLKAAKE